MAKVNSKSVKDTYAQVVTVNVEFDATVAAADDIVQVPSAISSDANIGMLINRYEIIGAIGYEFDAVMAGAGDEIYFGLCFASQLPAHHCIFPNDGGYLDMFRIDRVSVNLDILSRTPLVRDFSTLPGGGKLVHPSVLHAYSGTGDVLSNACVWIFSIYYTLVTLTDNMYKELWQSQIMLSTVI